MEASRDLLQFCQGALQDSRGAGHRAHYSASVLSVAAAGHRLPSWAVTSAFVTACGGDVDEWRERWTSLRAELQAAHPDLMADADADAPSGSSERVPAAAPDTAHEAESELPEPITPRTRSGRPVAVKIGFGAVAAVALATAGVLLAVNLVNSSESSGRTGGGTSPGKAPGAPPKAWTATSGPSCSTGNAMAMDTSGPIVAGR